MDSEEKLQNGEEVTEDGVATSCEDGEISELDVLRARLEKLENERDEADRRFFVISALEERKLPAELGEFIIADDREEILRRADALEDAISGAVKREVMRRMPRSAPIAGKNGKLSRADILNMSLAELSDYYV